jgi:large subunit ribosomal protein L13
MGKHKPTYTPHIDVGDFVVVTNAEKVQVTGKKEDQMEYASYSYYPGGHKVVPYKTMMQKHPEKIIMEAVRRMLPKNAKGKRLLTKLKVFTGTDHPHQAQQPEELDLTRV